VQVEYGDAPTATSRLKAQFMTALTAPGTGWTPSAAEACVQAIETASCADALANNLPAACHPPPGQLASGAACGDNGQCASGYCNLGPGGKCGTCAAALGAAGATCYRDNDCAYGTVCNGSDLTSTPVVSGKCASLGASGASCDDTHPCLRTLACNAGVCAMPAAASATCSQTGTDFFGSCSELDGYYCNKATNGTCTKISLAAAGAPCGGINGSITACSASGVCVPPNSASEKCMGPAADFGNCDSKKGPGCMAPADCIGGICTLPTPASCH
jgi:hypothetical protein